MGYKLKFLPSFKEDWQRCRREGIDLSGVTDTFHILQEEGGLPAEYDTHVLRHGYDHVYDSHVDNDLVLLWRKRGDTISFIRLGTHAELFKK